MSTCLHAMFPNRSIQCSTSCFKLFCLFVYLVVSVENSISIHTMLCSVTIVDYTHVHNILHYRLVAIVGYTHVQEIIVGCTLVGSATAAGHLPTSSSHSTTHS